ncbi:MAG: transcriptional regulator [Salinisphaeraceae bacterium]|nr:transcriptional regulator [Salinisphaeraceae bacterium]
MRRRERLLKLHEMLMHARVPVPKARLLEQLACSDATFYRVLAELRDELGAPVVASSDPPGYRYDDSLGAFELPGLWFSAEEIYALLAAEQLLTELDPGLIGNALEPLRTRIRSLLGNGDQTSLDNLRRIRILRTLGRFTEPLALRLCTQAVLSRKQLGFDYVSRGSNQHSRRLVCPQRLTHYRDNWYLDAWCHQASALRTFSVDRISAIESQAEHARDVSEQLLNEELGGSFGIFAGTADQRAVLRFSKERAEWVADESWHPDQTSARLPDGRLELHIPFRHAEELMMDVLKHGPAVEIVAPADLRNRVADLHAEAARQYE